MKLCFLVSLCTLLLTSVVNGQSLFNAYHYRPLIADRTASHIGDLLTVLVMEISNAQSSADLASAKDIKTSLEVGYNKDEHEISFGLSGKGKTAAKTGRNGKIKAALTVRIKKRFPNDSFLVEGIHSTLAIF